MVIAGVAAGEAGADCSFLISAVSCFHWAWVTPAGAAATAVVGAGEEDAPPPKSRAACRTESSSRRRRALQRPAPAPPQQRSTEWRPRRPRRRARPATSSVRAGPKSGRGSAALAPA
eukprot:4622789-Prymnesium_polylepis.2